MPLVGQTTRALSEWLGGGVLELRANLDDVEALSPEREASRRRRASRSVGSARQGDVPDAGGEAGGGVSTTRPRSGTSMRSIATR